MKQLDPRDYLEAPAWEWDSDTTARFDRLFDRAQARGPGTLIPYNDPLPKAAFLAYLAERRGLLMHGSNHGSIRELQPKPQTNYLGEPVRCIFATADGIWPMFFAILDREIYEGSIRNGCFWVDDAEGDRHKCYHFSINGRLLARAPWTDGTIYIVPREPFHQERDLAGNPLEEWVSETPVTPLARLRVSPADFPFLDRVAGHDEAALERIEEAPGEIFKGFHDLTELEDGYALRYDGNPAWDARLIRFIRLQQSDNPRLTFELIFEPGEGPVTLRVRGPKAEIREKLHTFLDARNTPEPAILPDAPADPASPGA